MPINNVNDLNFSRPKLTLSPEELEEVRRRIIEGF
jgi:hypothetical protein